jgi:hypothetical protein
VPRLRGNRLIDLLSPVHLLIPGPLLTAPHHRVSNYIITCTINLANVRPSDYPIFAGINDTPMCACVLHALSTRARKGTSVRPRSLTADAVRAVGVDLV